MNVDITKLKALAEAAPAGPWYPPDEGSSIGMVFDRDLGSLLNYESIDTERDACVAYVAAANPAAVLELIKEIESLRAGWYENEFTDLKNWPEELAELKAENEALRKDAERYRWMRTRVGIVQGFGNFTPYSHGVEPLSDDESEESDAAIDAAMSKDGSHD